MILMLKEHLKSYPASGELRKEKHNKNII